VEEKIILQGEQPLLQVTFVLAANPVNARVTSGMPETYNIIQSTWPLIPDKKTPQGYGSALTYGRRYLLQTMCGLSAEDDDGNAASEREQPAPPASNHPNAPPQAKPEPTVDRSEFPQITTGHIMDVQTKDGKRSNGTPWTRYGVKLDSNQWFNTFDTRIGERALTLKDTGTLVEIQYTTNDKGYHDLTELFEANRQHDPSEGHDPTQGMGEIPF
jgi:hypothetical protein